MSNEFLPSPNAITVLNVIDGTVDAYLASLTVADLDASLPLKTNSINTIVSSKLDIADINDLETRLDTITPNPFNDTFEAIDFKTNTYTSVNAELQKIDNFTASSQVPDITNITGLLNTTEIATNKIQDPTQTTAIELNNTDINIVGTNLTFNSLPVSTAVASLGGRQNLYLNDSVTSDISGYKSLGENITNGVSSIVPYILNQSPGVEQLLEEFITDVDFPNNILIPEAIASLILYATISSSTGSTTIHYKLFKRDPGGAETLLITSDNSNDINSTDPIFPDRLIIDLAIVSTPILTTDRLVLKLYGQKTTVSDKTVSIYYEGTSFYSYWISTFTGLEAYILAPPQPVFSDTIPLYDGTTGKILKTSNMSYTNNTLSVNGNVVLTTADKAQANGLATLDGNSLVPVNQIDITHNQISDFDDEVTILVDSQKGQSLGLAPLDSSGKIDLAYIKLNDVKYCGAWNALLNTNPTLASSVGETGCYYVVSAAGSTNLNGITDWKVNDWAIYNGVDNIWQKVDNTDQVSSVAGKIGLVTLQLNSDLTDVNTAGVANTDLLVYDSSSLTWVKKTRAEVGFTALETKTQKQNATSTETTFTGKVLADSFSSNTITSTGSALNLSNTNGDFVDISSNLVSVKSGLIMNLEAPNIITKGLLQPEANNTRDIGTAAISYKDIYAKSVKVDAPVNNTDATNKTYVDGLITPLQDKTQLITTSVTDITISRVLTSNTSSSEWKTSASSNSSSAFELSDGDVNTIWQSNNGTYDVTTGEATSADQFQVSSGSTPINGSWVKFENDTPYKVISQYKMTGRYASVSITDWKVYVSLDDITYTLVDTRTNQATSSNLITYNIAPVATKYTVIHILKREITGTSNIFIREVEFNGLADVTSNFVGAINVIVPPLTDTELTNKAYVDSYSGTILQTDRIRANNEGAVTGNARGQYSVDLQQFRANATEVASGARSSIIGGSDNTVSNLYSIAGGYQNTVTGNNSISFGAENLTSGNNSSTIGRNNTASSDYSVAMGRYAQANNVGSFVWSDNSSSTPFQSSANNSFNIRAAGGINLQTIEPNSTTRTTSGKYLPIIINGNLYHLLLYGPS